MNNMDGEKQIKNFLLKFGDRFELLEFGINESYELNGCWLKLKTKSPVSMNSFSTGSIIFTISNNIITVNKGFLQDMCHGLAMIASQLNDN